METSTPDEAASALAEAAADRDRLSRRIVLPAYFHTSLGVAIGLQIFTGGLGIADQSGTGIAILAAGLVVLVLVVGVQLARFRRLNGVWLGGLLSSVVLGTAPAASTAYALSFAAAVWAAFEEVWWVVVVAAAAGGAAYAVSGVRWMGAYREDPARHGRGESALLMLLLAVPVLAGAVLLVVDR